MLNCKKKLFFLEIHIFIGAIVLMLSEVKGLAKYQITYKVRSLKKKTILFGNFSQTSDPPHPPPPHPPFWEPLIQKKNLVFILHFRLLGTFLIFTKKIKILSIFFLLLLGIGGPPPSPTPTPSLRAYL